jgi:hypothetical protein
MNNLGKIRGKHEKRTMLSHEKCESVEKCGKVLKSVRFSVIFLVYIKIPYSEKYPFESLWRPRQ